MTTAQETPDSDRLSRLEVTVDYLVREVGDIKADLRQMRIDFGEHNRALREALDRDRQESREALDRNRQGLRRDFRVLVGTIVAMMVATWALIGTVLVTSV